MGYSNAINVSDATQDAVLKAEFAGMATVPYIVGANYWVGAGTSNSGGYTHLFAGNTGAWTLRPAAHDLAAFYDLWKRCRAPRHRRRARRRRRLKSTPVPPTRYEHGRATDDSKHDCTAHCDELTLQYHLGDHRRRFPSARLRRQSASPTTWHSSDIGNVGAVGSQSLDHGVWTVRGSGADIYSTSDGFELRLAYPHRRRQPRSTRHLTNARDPVGQDRRHDAGKHREWLCVLCRDRHTGPKACLSNTGAGRAPTCIAAL